MACKGPFIFILILLAIHQASGFNSRARLSNNQNTRIFPFDVKGWSSSDSASTDYEPEDIKVELDIIGDDVELFFKEKKEMIKKQTHDKELNFIALGDFGYIKDDQPHPEQEIFGNFVANRVKRTFFNYDFILTVGDNFYPFGLDSRTDPRAEIVLEDTFQMSSLDLDWYAIMGNHDLMGDLDAALALHERYPLWKQTEPYYSEVFNLGSSPLKAGFIFLHSCDLVCREKENLECYNGTQKNVNFNGIQAQLDWFEATLIEMSFDPNIIWKVVVIHNAIFSAGERHGDNLDLQELVLPLLRKHKVDLVLSGHDHSVQYLRTDMTEKKVEDESELTSECPQEPNLGYCSEQEFFYYELDKCGLINKPQGFGFLNSVYQNSLFDLFASKYSRESIVRQHEYIHQFVLGNGGIKHEKLCPVKQMKSQGKLRYGHSVSGIADIKIREDRMEVALVSVDSDSLYSLEIFRDKTDQ